MKVYKSTLLTIICAVIVGFSSIAQPMAKERDEIDAAYKWDLSDIFADWNAWEGAFGELQEKMQEIVALKGQISKDPQSLLNVLKIQDDLGMIAYKVYTYPMFMYNLDARNTEVLGKLQQVQVAFAQFGSATAWIAPELLTVPQEKMMEWISQNPDLERYRFDMESMYHSQQHVLTEDKELLMSYFSQATGAASEVYDNLTTADMVYPDVTLTDGTVVKVTPGAYSNILSTSTVREDRKLVKEAFYPLYADKLNTFAAIYKGIVDNGWAYAQARNYSSCLESNLHGNDIPVAVYENLVNTVKANTAPLQKYHKLRAKHFGLEGDYHGYDSRLTLGDSEATYEFDAAKEMVLKSVKPLGKEYTEKLETALASGWIDVFETTAKRSGAYSMNVYGVHPFIMLNYNGTLDYVFTLAHELGHSLHSIHSSENQPFNTASYTIFVAEVASTFNEKLLLDQMLEEVKDPKERVALLQQAIEGIAGTFYTQTMFADFELQAHQLAEKGMPVTAESLTAIAEELDQAYYGETFVKDPAFKSIFWSRIPHFYGTPFYVYQYATSYAASYKLNELINTGSKKERKEAVDSYLNLLSSGGNDYPINQLKKAGVDMTSPETIMAVINQLSKLVDQLEVELNNLEK
ncbi:MAG: oligoendopeptidase F [Bacteroidales bacterium]|nr:oligoendopeptidase F [Bacteroidales bacterium]